MCAGRHSSCSAVETWPTGDRTSRTREAVRGSGVLQVPDRTLAARPGDRSLLCGSSAKSAPSISANYHSAGRSRSRARIHARRLGVVVDEADETVGWLELLKETCPATGPELDRLLAKAASSGQSSSSRLKTARLNDHTSAWTSQSLTSSLPHFLTSSLPHFLTSSLPHFLTSPIGSPRGSLRRSTGTHRFSRSSPGATGRRRRTLPTDPRWLRRRRPERWRTLESLSPAS